MRRCREDQRDAGASSASDSRALTPGGGPPLRDAWGVLAFEECWLRTSQPSPIQIEAAVSDS